MIERPGFKSVSSSSYVNELRVQQLRAKADCFSVMTRTLRAVGGEGSSQVGKMTADMVKQAYKLHVPTASKGSINDVRFINIFERLQISAISTNVCDIGK